MLSKNNSLETFRSQGKSKNNAVTAVDAIKWIKRHLTSNDLIKNAEKVRITKNYDIF